MLLLHLPEVSEDIVLLGESVSVLLDLLFEFLDDLDSDLDEVLLEDEGLFEFFDTDPEILLFLELDVFGQLCEHVVPGEFLQPHSVALFVEDLAVDGVDDLHEADFVDEDDTPLVRFHLLEPPQYKAAGEIVDQDQVHNLDDQ